jgi:O-antigen ligase
VAKRNEKIPTGIRIYDATIAEMPSRLSTTIFVIICSVTIVATLLYGAVDTFALSLLSLATASIFCLWIIHAWREGEFRFSTSLLQIPIIVLIVVGVIQLLPLSAPGLPAGALNVAPSMAISLDPFATRLFVVRLVSYLIFFAAALTFINSQKRAKRLAVTIAIFGSVLAFFGILQRLADPDAIYGLRPTPQAIPFGPYVNQHHFAAFMEMTGGIVFGLLLGGGMKRDRKAFLLIAAILMSIALLFTGSRGGVISFAGVIAFTVAATYIFRGKKSSRNVEPAAARRNFTVLTAGAALGLLIIGSVFYLGGGDSMLRGFGVQQMQTDVSSGRIHYWQVAFEIFKAHPILGAGFDAFGNAFTRYDTLSGAFRVEQAHNDYLQMLADGGLIGFTSVIIFAILLFRNGIRNIASTGDELSRSIAIGAVAGCFGIAIHSFFDFPLRTPSNALFFLLLVVLATTRFSERKT